MVLFNVWLLLNSAAMQRSPEKYWVESGRECRSEYGQTYLCINYSNCYPGKYGEPPKGYPNVCRYSSGEHPILCCTENNKSIQVLSSSSSSSFSVPSSLSLSSSSASSSSTLYEPPKSLSSSSSSSLSSSTPYEPPKSYNESQRQGYDTELGYGWWDASNQYYPLGFPQHESEYALYSQHQLGHSHNIGEEYCQFGHAINPYNKPHPVYGPPNYQPPIQNYQQPEYSIQRSQEINSYNMPSPNFIAPNYEQTKFYVQPGGNIHQADFNQNQQKPSSLTISNQHNHNQQLPIISRPISPAPSSQNRQQPKNYLQPEDNIHQADFKQNQQQSSSSGLSNQHNHNQELPITPRPVSLAPSSQNRQQQNMPAQHDHQAHQNVGTQNRQDQDISSHNHTGPVILPLSPLPDENMALAAVIQGSTKENLNIQIPYYEPSFQNSTSLKKCQEYLTAIPLLKPKHFPIIGGRNASAKEFPHLAILGYGREDDIQWNCGGTLISEEYILTAAHCLTARGFGRVRYVRLGELDLATTDEDVDVRDLRVAQTIRHPLYSALSNYHDIGLIRLSTPITSFSVYVRPACLATKRDLSNNTMVIVGWGLTEYQGDRATLLQRTTLELVSNERCRNIYGTPRNLRYSIIEELQICADGGKERRDACQGDSGGPLQFANYLREPDLSGFIEVAGITSFGQGCGQTAGVYTRVLPYVRWIERIVWPND